MPLNVEITAREINKNNSNNILSVYARLSQDGVKQIVKHDPLQANYRKHTVFETVLSEGKIPKMWKASIKYSLLNIYCIVTNNYSSGFPPF